MWNRRHPDFMIAHDPVAGGASASLGEAAEHLGSSDPAPRQLVSALEAFLKTLRIRHGLNTTLRGRGLRVVFDLMDERDRQEFGDLYPAVNEWGLRISLLLRKFYPEEDLFEAPYPVNALLDKEEDERHPASAFIAACLLWGKSLVGKREADLARVRRWIRPRRRRLLLLGWDPRQARPAEVELRTELTTLQHLIGRALGRGDALDAAAYLAALRAAQGAARKARRMVTPTHARYVALPLDADLRAASAFARGERERRLRRRIQQLHGQGLTANAIAERLGRDPQTVRRKLTR
ncbi:MAG: helix-turn-helix domain-containing protein [Thermoleophilaceae bacterium]